MIAKRKLHSRSSNRYWYTLVCTIFLFQLTGKLYAIADTTYYKSYPKLLTTRFYFSQKYTTLTIRNKDEHYRLHYLPNTTLNIGIGATYKWATLNLGYGFGFLNPDKGKTKYLDLQFHGYGQKFNLDLLGQFYKGFYLFPKGIARAGAYYNRPDLRVNIIGGSFQYIVNNKRYSFRSSVFQNAWQKKSAGTILIGTELYGGRIKADSTFVPKEISEKVATVDERRNGFFEVGANVGYAYTYVIRKHYFLMGSVSASANYIVSSVIDNRGKRYQQGFNTNTFIRGGIGYNSNVWAISVVYVNNGVKLTPANSHRAVILNTGNLRLNFVYRFALARRKRRLLDSAIQKFNIER